MSWIDRSRSDLARSSLLARIVVPVAVLLCACVAVLALTSGQAGRAGAAGRANPDVALTWTEPSIPAVLFVGDAYTAGTGADTPNSGYAWQVADAMGWICLTDTATGAGYLGDRRGQSKVATSFGQRLAAEARTYRPDVVVVDGGRDDGALPLADVTAAIGSYLSRLHATFPAARLVLIAPSYVFATPADYPFGVQLAARLQELGRPYHAVVLDPLGQGWFPHARWRSLAAPDRIYPNQAGHTLFAQRLTAALKAAGLGRLKAPARSL